LCVKPIERADELAEHPDFMVQSPQCAIAHTRYGYCIRGG
jgi:hypothetical protein